MSASTVAGSSWRACCMTTGLATRMPELLALPTANCPRRAGIAIIAKSRALPARSTGARRSQDCEATISESGDWLRNRGVRLRQVEANAPISPNPLAKYFRMRNQGGRPDVSGSAILPKRNGNLRRWPTRSTGAALLHLAEYAAQGHAGPVVPRSQNLRRSAPAEEVHDQDHKEDHDEDVEQELSNAGGRSSDPAKPKHCGYDRDNQRNKRPIK